MRTLLLCLISLVLFSPYSLADYHVGNLAVTGVGGTADPLTAGNVGIGTTAPGAALEVDSSGSTIAIFKSYNGTAFKLDQYANFFITNENEIGLGYDTNVGDYAITTQATNYPLFITTGAGQSNHNNINIIPGGTGNIGLGTFSPGYFLDAVNNPMQVGSIHLQNPVFNVTSQSGQTFDPTGNGTLVYFTSPGRLVGINTIPAYQLDVNGTIHSTAFTMSGGGPSNGAVLTATDTTGDTTWTNAGSNFWLLGTGNVGIGTINTNVGIGSLTPGEQLDVLGTVRATGFTAGAGGITLGGTTNTSWPSTSQWTGTTGSNIYYSQAGANVGIGSVNPGTALDVNGTVRASYFYGNGSVLSGIPLSVSNSDGSLTITPTTGAVIGSLNTSHANTWTGQQIFNTSNVGIGSTNPGTKLDVQGTVRATYFIGNGSLLSNLPAASQWTTTNTNDVYLPNNGNVGIGTTITNQGGALVVMNGNVGIGTWAPTAPFQVAGLGVLTVTGNIGIGTSFSTNGFDDSKNAAIGQTYAGYFNAPSNGLIVSGNVGIGSNNPGQVLDVQGTVRATGFTLNGATSGTIVCNLNGQFGHCTSGASCLTTCTCTCVVP